MDPQSEAVRESYVRSQMQMRQWNKELNEFAKMQELYGKDAPYKTLGAFRRAYRSEEDSLPYAKTHYYRRDTKEFNEFKGILGAENVPETFDNFREIKYNNKKQFSNLVEFREFKKDNPNATRVDFETAKNVKACVAKGDVNIPPKILNTKEYAYNEAHIFDERHHNIVREKAENYIKNSCISLTQRKGERIVYISEKGLLALI